MSNIEEIIESLEIELVNTDMQMVEARGQGDDEEYDILIEVRDHIYQAIKLLEEIK